MQGLSTNQLILGTETISANAGTLYINGSQITGTSSPQIITGVSISGGIAVTGALNINAGSNVTLTQAGKNSFSISSAAAAQSTTNGVTGISITGGVAISGNIGLSSVGDVTLKQLGNSIQISGNTTETFSKSTVFFHPTGIENNLYNFPIWRAPFACQVTGIHGLRISGAGATINARKNFVSSHMTTNLSLTSTGVWFSSGIISNSSYVAGDTLEGRIISATTSPVSISIQVDFITN